MGIPLPVEAQFDERSATAAANRAERAFAEAGRNAGQGFSRSFSSGAQGLDDELKRIGDKASDAYDRARDAAGKLRAEEERLAQVREAGARNDQIVAQAERVERARRAEARAIRDATNAYSDYENAAENAGRGGGESFMGGLRGATSGAASAGQEAADGFSGGFLGAAGMSGMSGAVLRAGGWAAAGVMAAKLMVEGISDGMASLSMKDVYQAKLGVDAQTMVKLGENAAAAYAGGWGSSIEQNIEAQQFGIQAGLINSGATGAELQELIAQMDTMQSVIGEDAQSIARGSMSFVKTGLASSTTEAFDVLVAASQQGLNISGDLLDSANEYAVAWQGVGLSAQDALGMVKQIWKGGAKDSDQAADALKELAINVVDSEPLTRQAFAAMGFNADELTRKFAEGGPAARQAFGEVLTGLQQLDDPVEKQNVGMALFKTKWEDAKKAIENADLPTAAAQLGQVTGATAKASDTISQHADQWDLLGRNIEKAKTQLTEYLADSELGKIYNLPATMLNDLIDPSRIDARYGPPGAIDGAAPGVPLSPSALLNGGLQGAPQLSLNDMLSPVDVGTISPGWGFPTTPTTPNGLGTSLTPTERVTPVPMGSDTDGKPSIDPSRYSLDSIPIGQFIPGVQIPAAPGLVTPQGPGSYQVDPQRAYDAETARLSAKQSAEQARLRVLELQDSGTATQQEITAAKSAAVTAERQYMSAQMKLAEAQQGTWKKLESTANKFTNGMGEIGAALDADFGLSDGLPGIAENLVKFLANLAFAPVVGALTGVQAASGYAGGGGLMGIMGANGMLGQQYMPGMAGMSAGAVTAGSYAGGAYPGDAALLAGVPAGRYSQTGNADLTQGIADCSSAVEDLVNIMDGRPTGGRSMSTHNADEWLTNHGFLPNNTGANIPGAFNVGFNPNHMQATLPGGTPFNWGSDSAAANRGIGGGGAFDPALTSHYYRPAGAPSMPSPFVPSAATPSPSMPAPAYAPLSPEGLTNPGLTPALAPSATPGGWFGTPSDQLNAQYPNGGGGGRGPILPRSPGAEIGGPGMLGASFGAAGPIPAPGLGSAGGQSYPTMGGPGAAGVGGLALDAINGAASSLNMIAPGAGQAAQVGIQLANRFAGFLGQSAGIGVSGLFETAFPSGDNPLESVGNSWFGKVIGGFAGARPALPNAAGQQAPPPNPNGGNNSGQPGSNGFTQNNTVNVENRKNLDEKDIVNQLRTYPIPGNHGTG